MSELLTFVQENGQLLLSAAALVLLLAVLVNQALLLGRTKRLQKNIDGITQKVGAYLAAVMEGEEEAAKETKGVQTASKKNGRSEEEDSRLISAVLQEIFP